MTRLRSMDLPRREVPPIRGRAGFTLIEVMVSIAIASVVVVGLYSLFTMQTRQFVFQDLQMEMHQNQRFAADVISRSVRMAGFGTNGRVVGYLGSDGDVDNDLPAIIAYDSWSGGGGTDAITVVYGDPSLVMNTEITTTANCETTTIDFDPNMLDYSSKLGEFTTNEMLLCFDYAAMDGMQSYLWVLSGDPTGTGELPVHDATAYLDYQSVCPAGDNLTPAMMCSKAEVLTFYIDNSDSTPGPGSPSRPVLMMDMDLDWPEADDIPLVEDIEDLQFEYCLEDADADGVLDDCNDASATWVDSITEAEGDAVQMVRIHLLVRSSRTDPNDTYSSTRPALANHAAAVSDDNYYRQVMTTEVSVRNLRLQAATAGL